MAHLLLEQAGLVPCLAAVAHRLLVLAELDLLVVVECPLQAALLAAVVDPLLVVLEARAVALLPAEACLLPVVWPEVACLLPVAELALRPPCNTRVGCI